MSIHSRQGIIQNINICILIGSSGQADALLLTPTEIYTLKKKSIAIKHCALVLPSQRLLRKSKKEMFLNKLLKAYKSAPAKY